MHYPPEVSQICGGMHALYECQLDYISRDMLSCYLSSRDPLSLAVMTCDLVTYHHPVGPNLIPFSYSLILAMIFRGHYDPRNMSI
jgi:hypothetical protein